MNSQEPPQFDTTLPGQVVRGCEADKITEEFLRRFRNADPAKIPSNVPTACMLQGRKGGGIFQSPKFLGKKRVFFFLESASLLHSADPQAVVNYLAQREPWEDYDICLFDESYEWCVGLTHNDDIIVSDPKEVFN
ncbi:MAG: hypothetical protein JWM16_5191 [Verrucomicrobiales bacterium]|nr:hypothetical protein [Verrucomicrobiales bacterium]